MLNREAIEVLYISRKVTFDLRCTCTIKDEDCNPRTREQGRIKGQLKAGCSLSSSLQHGEPLTRGYQSRQ